MIAIDFDGTIAEYDDWKGAGVVGKPIPGAVEFVRKVHELGFNVAIFSTRAASEEGKNAIIQWIHENKLGDIISGVTHEKSGMFELIVDDRGITFAGDYRSVLKEIIRRGHNKR